MTINIELRNLYNRFLEETVAIKSQVEFIEESLILKAVEERGGELTLSLIPSYKSIDDVHRQLNETVQELSISINELNERLVDNDYKEIPKKILNIDQRSEEGEFLQAILEIIDGGENNLKEIVGQIRADLEQFSARETQNIDWEFYIELLNNPDKIIEYVDLCLMINHNKEIQDINNSIDLLEHHIKLLSLVDIKNSTNIYRQAFIQLIAVFDTIVFACFKAKFNFNFFKWLKYFDDSSIKYHKISEFDDFETFQRETIELKLKNCYLKDLFIITRNQEKAIFIMNSDDAYPKFREMINRRNCHIHNNGIVDNGYLWSDTSNKETFNIYNLQVGDSLLIDKDYFSECATMCSNFISNFIGIDW